MSSTSAIFRANPGLIVAIALCVVVPLVLLVSALLMRSAGTSLRPVILLAVLLLPLVFIFLVGSLATAREPMLQANPTASLEVHDGHFVHPQNLFGLGVSTDQIRDAKAIFPEFLAEAELAELATVGTGETVLAAQFPSAESAKRAAASLWQTFQIHNTSGDEERGWRGKRGLNSDYIELFRSGRQLFFWTALTKRAAADRRIGSMLADIAPQTESRTLIPWLDVLPYLFRSGGVKVMSLSLLVVLYAVCFFKGAAWAGSSPALAGVSAVPASELATRLESINTLDVPFQLERGEKPNEFFVTWRYADAKWIDRARAHGLQRTFRIRMRLDEAAHTVRATDYAAGYDWSAGRGGAQIQWRATSGLVLFQTEHRRVFGVQLDEHGQLKPELSYAYQFNLNEMKSPLIAATTNAGWNWRPTMWQGPVWLRWLTE